MDVVPALVVALSGCLAREPRAELVTIEADRSAVAGSGVLVTAFLVDGPAFAVVVGGDGRIRWSYEAPPDRRVARVRRARDGTLWLGVNDPKHEERDGVILRVDLDGNVLSETVAPTFHHDLVELDDGRIAFLGHAFADVALEGFGVLPLGTDTVRIAEEEGESEVVFDFLVDYPVAPYWTCPHMERGEHLEGVNEWTHTNALVPTADGGFLLMPRYLDAIVALGPDLGVRWQLGGAGGDLDTQGERLFQHAHMSAAQGDRVLVFDNGWDHLGVKPARVVEVAVDVEGGTAATTWTYVEPGGEGTTFLGDAKWLPNGNVLVSWGGLDRVTEVTPDGEVVWAVELDRAVGRVELWEGPLP